MPKGLIVVLSFLALVAVIILMPNVMTSLESFRTNSQTDSRNVATAAAVTNASVTLSHSLWSDDTAEVSSIASDVTTDNPIASAYTTASKSLLITGLTANTASHNLTIIYATAALGSYAGADTLAGIWPLLMWMVVIGLAVAILIKALT